MLITLNHLKNILRALGRSLGPGKEGPSRHFPVALLDVWVPTSQGCGWQQMRQTGLRSRRNRLPYFLPLYPQASPLSYLSRNSWAYFRHHYKFWTTGENKLWRQKLEEWLLQWWRGYFNRKKHDGTFQGVGKPLSLHLAGGCREVYEKSLSSAVPFRLCILLYARKPLGTVSLPRVPPRRCRQLTCHLAAWPTFFWRQGKF